MEYILLYWFVGFVMWQVLYFQQGRDITLADVFIISLAAAWVWPIILGVIICINGQRIIVFKGRRSKGGENE